jgi:hypothetical protein
MSFVFGRGELHVGHVFFEDGTDVVAAVVLVVVVVVVGDTSFSTLSLLSSLVVVVVHVSSPSTSKLFSMCSMSSTWLVLHCGCLVLPSVFDCKDMFDVVHMQSIK